MSRHGQRKYKKLQVNASRFFQAVKNSEKLSVEQHYGRNSYSKSDYDSSTNRALEKAVPDGSNYRGGSRR
jgi:hypothetical protein